MFPEIFLSTIAETYVLPVLENQGFRALPSAQQEEMLQPLIEGAVVRLVAGITDRLTPDGQAVFNQLSTTEGSLDSWQSFWQEYLPDYESIAHDTLTAYQEELRSAVVG